MSNKRPTILAAILLALLAGYLCWPYLANRIAADQHAANTEPPLAGSNEISTLSVQRDASGRWMATVEYFYTGRPEGIGLRIGAFNGRNPPDLSDAATYPFAHVLVKRGAQRVTTELHRPNSNDASMTKTVAAQLFSNGQVIATQQIEQSIDWPTFETWFRNLESAKMTPTQNLDRAVALIDTGDRNNVEEARLILERLLTQDPRLDAAYVELARVAMKTNWGPAGLRQAENYLQSALQVSPGSVNAKVLQGYVYAHQGRHKPAEALFLEASKSDTKNQWLWVNWGESLEMQGKADAAAQKYREALSRPRTHDTYDRARQDAYIRLIALLSKRKDLDGVEAMYRQQLADFGAGNCFVNQYARFMLQERGHTAKAIQLARDLLEQRCTDVFTREVLGMAYYTQWASSNGPDKQQALNQARVYFPVAPKLLYWLATGDRTAVAAKALIASGEPIDQKDNAGATALAYAFQFEDHGAARRLLSMGARGDAPIGADAIPLGVLVVIGGDVDGVRLLQRHGLDVAGLRYRGKTALDYARQSGDRKLIEALESKSST